MPKSLFRIIAFRCLRPENPLEEECHFVNRMQRSLSKTDKWYKFYRDIEVNDDGSHVSIPNNFADDAMIYDTESLSISVSAIVGENGSGKSSILDMMVRVLNNVATALMGKNHNMLLRNTCIILNMYMGVCCLFRMKNCEDWM